MANFREFTNGSLEVKKEEFFKKLQENRRILEANLSLEKKDYQNFVYPYQKMNHDLDAIFTEISHLHSVKNSEETQRIYSELIPILTEYYTDLSQDPRILEAFRTALENGEKEKNLEIPAKKVLLDGIRNFSLNGVDLPEKEKQRVKAIQIRLSELSDQFSQNLLNATNAYEKIIKDPQDIEGIPQPDLLAAKQDDHTWKFTLHYPSYIAYMNNGPNRKIREELYRAYTTRAPENGKRIIEILSLRTELANILGFRNYAEYSLAFKMAESTEEVLNFLYELGAKARPRALDEWKELQTFTRSKGISDPQAFDIPYYSEWMKRECFEFNEDSYRPYFEKTAVVEGGFRFLEQLLGISFRKVDAKVWDPTVQVFEILKEDGEPAGRLYADLETRKDKKSGAWMQNWTSRHRNGEKTELPTAFIVANFPPSGKESPSLLRPNDVVTFFHEMGHALHHLLTEVEHPFVSGIHGVEWDAVEFPSQFFENFAYEKEALSFFAFHFQSGEPLPDELLQKLMDMKNFQSALGVLRQLEFAIFDLKLHIQPPEDEEGVQSLLDQVRSEIAVVKPPPYNRFQNGFSHIFAGGYAAGYYSYKWAELLSANAFMKVVEAGGIGSGLGRKYREEILAKGGSEPAIQLFRNFYGQDPEVEPLLRLLAII